MTSLGPNCFLKGPVSKRSHGAWGLQPVSLGRLALWLPGPSTCLSAPLGDAVSAELVWPQRWPVNFLGRGCTHFFEMPWFVVPQTLGLVLQLLSYSPTATPSGPASLGVCVLPASSAPGQPSPGKGFSRPLTL